MAFLHAYMPAYNTSRQTGPLIESLNRELSSLVRKGRISGYSMLVVDDGSTDGTSKLLATLSRKFTRLRVITLRKNRGVVKATLAALTEISKSAHADGIVVRMDSDFEHNPEDIERLIGPVREGKCAMCFAYLSPDLGQGIAFSLMNLIVGGYENLKLFGKWVPQFCPGYYAIGAGALKRSLPKLRRAASAYRKMFGSEMIGIDIFLGTLALKHGGVHFIKASPVGKEWLTGKPFSKTSRYVREHIRMMRFLNSKF